MEVSAVGVRGDWARYLAGQVTSPSGMYWAVKELPPHEGVATMVVKCDATTEPAC